MIDLLDLHPDAIVGLFQYKHVPQPQMHVDPGSLRAFHCVGRHLLRQSMMTGTRHHPVGLSIQGNQVVMPKKHSGNQHAESRHKAVNPPTRWPKALAGCANLVDGVHHLFFDVHGKLGVGPATGRFPDSASIVDGRQSAPARQNHASLGQAACVLATGFEITMAECQAPRAIRSNSRPSSSMSR